MLSYPEVVGLIVAPAKRARQAASAIRDVGLIPARQLWAVTPEGPETPVAGVAGTYPLEGLFRQEERPWGTDSSVFRILILSGPDPGDKNTLNFLRKVNRLICDLESQRFDACLGCRKPLTFLKIPLSNLCPGIEPPPRRQPIETDQNRIRGILRGVDGPILLEGSTGTGKTETAHCIANLVRPGKALHLVNCGALHEADREARFRGVAKDAFTGVKERLSLFKVADGGTVLLDDFQELTVGHQATLLDLLDPFSCRVVGTVLGNDKQIWEADVQVILAINQPLEHLLHTGQLRADLFHRVQRRLSLPPLATLLHGSLGDIDKVKAFLRHRIISMQERALRIYSSEWEGLGSLREQFHQSLGLFAKNSETLVALPETDLSECTPIPDSMLNHPWKGNFRELDGFAHHLMRAQDGKIAKWSMGHAEEALKAVSVPIPSQGETEQQPGLMTDAQRHLALAYLQASRCPSLGQASSQLELDKRTFKARLEEVLAGRSRKFLEKLSEQERIEIRDNAKRLLKNSRLSKTM